MLSMYLIYFWSAAVGGGLLVISLLLTLLGGDADADVDVDVDADLDGDVAGGGLSFRTVVAFLTFFGLTGMLGLKLGWSEVLSLGVAVLAGGCAFWLVGLAMLQLHRLRSSGNVDINNAVGVEGKVYLKIPPERSGTGTVTVPIQGRTMQYKAVTKGAEIKTGEFCRVIAVHAGDTLEVEAV
jgi:hypothetical protein